MTEGRRWTSEFQCFHLVRELYARAGVDLPDPHDELLQAARAGRVLFREVDPNTEPLCVADLLVIDGDDGPHLAMIEAPNRAVQVTSNLGIFRIEADRLIRCDHAQVLRYTGPGHEKLAV